MRTRLTQHLFFFTLLTVPLLRAGATNELDTLKASYVAEKVRLDGVFAQQKTNALVVYRQSVDVQLIAAKQKGDLDACLALAAEKHRLATNLTVRTQDDPTLSDLTTQHQKCLLEATNTRDKAKLNLLRLYITKLTTLMQNFTRADRFTEAKLVRDELQLAKTEWTFLEADAPPEPAKPLPPVSPAPPPEDPSTTLAGTWTFTWRNAGKSGTDTILLTDDGTASCPKDNSQGRWEVKNGQCLIHWPHTDNTLTISSDNKHMTGHNKQGSSLTATKIASP